jgi:hypothetical protein
MDFIPAASPLPLALANVLGLLYQQVKVTGTTFTMFFISLLHQYRKRLPSRFVTKEEKSNFPRSTCLRCADMALILALSQRYLGATHLCLGWTAQLYSLACVTRHRGLRRICSTCESVGILRLISSDRGREPGRYIYRCR